MQASCGSRRAVPGSLGRSRSCHHVAVRIGRIVGGRRDVAVRQVVNAVTLATPLGLALARLGRAHLVRGPDGLLLALDYRFPVPAPRAPAVTVGDVVLLRMNAVDVAARPGLLVHE